VNRDSKTGSVLFDVDETLVHTGGSGARSWKVAFEKLYGIPADIGEHSSAGETGPAGSSGNVQRRRRPRPQASTELAKLYAQYCCT